MSLVEMNFLGFLSDYTRFYSLLIFVNIITCFTTIETPKFAHKE